MDNLNINKLLDRENIRDDIIKHLELLNINDKLTKRGFYIYGNSGVGKTQFIINLLNELDYDIIYYDASDIRNRQTIEMITNNNIGNKNVYSMFNKKIKNIAIVMDEIDGLTSSDKGGLASLIKLIRPKKTKKQKKEPYSVNPIFFISNYHVDKKIKELLKITFNYELKKPTEEQVKQIINYHMNNINTEMKNIIVNFIDGDLRKLNSFYNIYTNDHNILDKELIGTIFQTKINNDYTKDTVRTLMNKKILSNEHSLIMNETDRTIISLLYHENIIDGIKQNFNKKDSINMYYDILDNYTFCDYMDRLTFQKQIWIFNEISSLIKVVESNNIYHNNLQDTDKDKKYKVYNPKEVRFTKILTKYSTEYNNSLFTQDLCQKLNLDKKDMMSFFLNLRDTKDMNEIIQFLSNYDIHKLDILRLLKYIDKYTLGET